MVDLIKLYLIKIIPYLLKKFFTKNIKKLNDNLMLIYTGISRTAHKIANQYVINLIQIKRKSILNIIRYVKKVNVF